jgi:hypothetical protein
MQRQSGLQKVLAKPRMDKGKPVENTEHMAQVTKPSEGIRDMHLVNVGEGYLSTSPLGVC